MIARGLRLKAGELVVVRRKEEILGTLDEKGCLDGLPFMPEMFEFCGRPMKVYKRAHKMCDTIHNTGNRGVREAVHLEGVRCSGQAHGGCDAECLIFWKEAWLMRAATGGRNEAGASLEPAGALPLSSDEGRKCTEEEVLAGACRTGEAGGCEAAYVCQATRMTEASFPLRRWDLRQYWEDYTSGNFGLKFMLGVFCYATYTNLMRVARGWGVRRMLLLIYNGVQAVRGRPRHPRARGKISLGGRTPAVSLNLQPGELVRVKSFEAILETIDWNYYNRGLRWDAEMVPYCGRIYRVKKRVKRLIEEKTGKLLELKSEPLILEGVTCQSKYSNCRYFCPRSIYPYWREIWLERVGTQATPNRL